MEERETPQPVIVCAALRFGDFIVTGPRHYDSTMRSQIKAARSVLPEVKPDQGFVDQFGAFYDRKEALIIAEAANQINVRREKGFPKDELFSEDLY